jgi:tRNA (guanosine-2'-O-)-methyltransferase
LQASNLTTPAGVTLVQACTPTGVELCFNAVDDNCNGVIDEGCGEPTGPLQFVIAWAEAKRNVDLAVTVPGGDVVTAKQRSSATGFQLDHDCPDAPDCNGQNEEDVFFDGTGDPPTGHYSVEIKLGTSRDADASVDGAPLQVRFGARLGSRVIGFDVQLTPGQDASKTFAFDVP